MAEWLIEYGIGEDRAVLLEQDNIIAAHIHWPGELIAGQVVEAKLLSLSQNQAGKNARGIAERNGEQIFVSRLSQTGPEPAPPLSEGSPVNIEITRSVIAERGRLKMAQGRLTQAPVRDLDLAASIRLGGDTMRTVRHIPSAIWDDLLSDALSGEVHFDGGTLLFCPTPAMIVVDIDGTLPPRDLAMAAIPPLAEAIRRFDIGGMIGIDFPTIESKADRKAVDHALAEALSGWPHESTAMNGFGFVQLVARLQRPSLLHRAAHSRIAMLARQALRRAELVEEPGAIQLNIHPALSAKLKPKWLSELSRRTGREVRIEIVSGLALEGSFAQAVPL